VGTAAILLLLGGATGWWGPVLRMRLTLDAYAKELRQARSGAEERAILARLSNWLVDRRAFGYYAIRRSDTGDLVENPATVVGGSCHLVLDLHIRLHEKSLAGVDVPFLQWWSLNHVLIDKGNAAILSLGAWGVKYSTKEIESMKDGNSN